MSRSLDPVADAAFILADKVRAERDEALEALRAIIGCGPHTTGAELDNVLIAASAILSKHQQPEGDEK